LSFTERPLLFIYIDAYSLTADGWFRGNSTVTNWLLFRYISWQGKPV